MQVCLYGVRGSVPVHGADYAAYGGATSCTVVRAGNETIILDAGTGLCHAAVSTDRFAVLLSHAHADHIMGLPMFSPLFDKTGKGSIYLRTREGCSGREQIEKLMSPPLWPVNTSAFAADVRFCDIAHRFTVGDVTVETLEVCHPGGCTAYRLTYGGKSLVYATDLEARDTEDAFAAFAKGCDLLLLDAQYTEEEYTRTKGFGHTSLPRSIALAEECCAENTIFIHHDPRRTDAVLSAWDKELGRTHPRMHFGRQGEEVYL